MVCVKLLRFLFPTEVSVLKLYWKGHLSLKSRGFPILHLTLELDQKLRERERADLEYLVDIVRHLVNALHGRDLDVLMLTGVTSVT